jgi:hypothetical protein
MTPVPRDVLAILIVVFVTFTLGAFRATAVVPAILHLGRSMWPLGVVWQVFTYPFAGFGGPSLWILLEHSRDVSHRAGREARSGRGRRRGKLHLLFLWSCFGDGLKCAHSQP